MLRKWWFLGWFQVAFLGLDDSNDDFLMILGSIPGNCWKPDDFLMIQSMIFWWFGETGLGMIFWKNWGKSSKNHLNHQKIIPLTLSISPNHQKIIDFGMIPNWFSFWGNRCWGWMKKLRENQKIDDFLMIFPQFSLNKNDWIPKSMIFWWFPFLKMIFWKNWGKSSKNHRLNHQKIIDFGMFQSFCNMFNENQGKIPKSMIFWWFPSVFSKNHPQTGFPKSSKNHRLNHQKIIGFSTIPRNATQNHQKIIVWIINFLHISTGLPLFQSFWNIFNENQGNLWEYPKNDDFLIIQTMTFWWFPSVFSKNHPQQWKHQWTVWKLNENNEHVKWSVRGQTQKQNT